MMLDIYSNIASLKLIEIKTNFVCYSSRKVNFGQDSGIPILHSCVIMKLCTQPATHSNSLKITD